MPVAQVYKPPYLFKGRRPVIEDAPEEIAYGEHLRPAGLRARRIGSVALVMPSPQTHKWDWGNRYVELAFDGGEDGRLTAVAPAAPGACAARVLHAVRPEPRRRAQRGEARPLQRSRMTARA